MRSVLLWGAACWLVIEAAAAVAGAPLDHWNDIRLSRSLALTMGVPLYPAADTLGPIFGTLHLPLSHVLYVPALAFGTPGHAIMAGSALSILFVSGPMAWLLLRRHDAASRLALLALLSVCLQSFSIAFPMTSIHADAAAIGFALAATGCVFRGRHWVLAGVLSAACVAAKQTMIGVPVGLALWVAWVDGRRALLRFALGLAGGTCAGAALAVAIAGSADALIFNVVTLAGHRPGKEDWAEVAGNGLRWLRWEGTAAVVCVAVALVTARRRAAGETIASQNRWLVFGVVALAQAPVLFKAWLTQGGDVNHLGMVLVLIWTGTVLGLRDMSNGAMSRALLTVLLVVNLSPAAPVRLVSQWRKAMTNPSDEAFRIVQENRARVWFPWHPLAHGMGERRMYHVDFPLKDRELAGWPVSAAQFKAGLPDELELIALPADGYPDSHALREFLKGFQRAEDAAPANWAVYRVP